MNPAAKVGGFAAGLAAVFGLALGGGALTGPVADPEPPAHAHQPSPSSSAGHASHTGQQPAGPAAADESDAPGGLQVAQSGYRLALARPSTQPGRQPIAFTISDSAGRVVRAYDVQHEKRLHLIAVRRDLTGFQHVHPTLGVDGQWSVPLNLSAGQWRIFVDFKASGGPALTLGQDLAVAGDYRPTPPAAPDATATVDGYDVALTGQLVAGRMTPLTLTVSRGGKPVTDLRPYLGAYGHLVALRSGDLAYLHVHPDGAPGDGKTRPGPDVTFMATAPSAGDYRLFLDFRHGGAVRTAEFAVRVNPTDTQADTKSDHDATPHTH